MIQKPSHNLVAKAIGEIHSSLKKYSSNKNILLAISGGRDSIALLMACNILRKFEYNIFIGHINHKLRIEAEEEEKYVSSLCEELDIPFISQSLNLEKGADLANRARIARKNSLMEIAEKFDCKIILLGHTKTDQCETLLMHMIRGCGLNGLGSMEIWNSPFLRPFLRISRDETTELCKLFDVKYFDDPSNLNINLFRSFVRENILSKMREFQANVEDNICNLADQARASEEILNDVASEFENKIYLRNFVWNNKLTNANEDLRNRVLRIMMIKANIDLQKIAFRTISNISDCIECKLHGREFQLPKGKMKINRDFIIIE